VITGTSSLFHARQLLFGRRAFVTPGVEDEKQKYHNPQNKKDNYARTVFPKLLYAAKNRRLHATLLYTKPEQLSISKFALGRCTPSLAG